MSNHWTGLLDLNFTTKFHFPVQLIMTTNRLVYNSLLGDIYLTQSIVGTKVACIPTRRR